MRIKKYWQIFTMAFIAAIFLFTAGVASAAIQVNVMPSGLASPINKWDSRPYIWPGQELELWGNVAGSGTMTYTWSFGDGSADVTGTVTNANNIAVTHTYAATGSYIATLTVSNGPELDTDTVYIDVVPVSDKVKVNLAIQRALKYLYINRQTTSAYGCSMYYWSTTDTYGDTGLAVLAFEDHGHRALNDRTKDIYADTVVLGLKYIEATLRATGAANTPNTDADINGNNLKTYAANGNMYNQGIYAMALANTQTPNAVAACGYNTNITGMTYKTLVEDMVDYLAYAQNDSGNYLGGWRYSANYSSSDNSVSQWPALGLIAAEGAKDAVGVNWGITAPAWVKTRMPNWLNYSQYSNGGFGYTYASEWVNIAKTGSGIIAMKYAGIGDPKLSNAINYIATNWGATGNDYGNKGDHYAMYAVKKGLQYAGVTTVGGHNWQEEYNAWYVANQVNDGTNGVYWPGSVRIGAGRTTAAFGLLVMAPGLVESPPVANAGADQEVAPNVNVSFNGSASHPTDPTHPIVTYEWDFDYNGVTFDVDATGVVLTKGGGYSLPVGQDTKNFTVALRVTDSVGLQGTDVAIVTVSNGNSAPVSNPGGPYLCGVDEVISLNGTGSYDPNACPVGSGSGCLGDSIASYEWDLDGDGVYDDATGATPNFTCSTIGTKNIALKVTDTYGRSAAQSSVATTVAVSDLQPVCYVNTLNSYNRATGKWTVAWKLKLKNQGNAAATAVSAKMTATSIPAGVTVLDDSMAWGGSIDPTEVQLSDDEFRYVYPRTIGGPNLSNITWDIEFTDGAGTRRVVRNIPQGSGTCQ